MRLAAALLLIAAACAGGASSRRWDEPAVHRLRVTVSRDVVVDAPMLQPQGVRLRAALLRSLQLAGFRLPDMQGADLVIRLWLGRSAGGLTAELSAISPAGESIDDLRSTVRGAVDSDQALDDLARDLTRKLELSPRVQSLARAGSAGPPP